MIHHVELWTQDLKTTGRELSVLFEFLGWRVNPQPDWPEGMTFHDPSGSYVVLEQSPAVSGPHDRMKAGMNHLALTINSRERLDDLRRLSSTWGMTELFADSYPHAGGEDYTALYLESSEGFELEIVLEQAGQALDENEDGAS